MYAFSGYAMLFYQNVVWLDMMYMFPLLLIGVNKLINDNKIYQNYVNNLNDLHNYIDNVINIDKFDIKKRGNILFNSGGVLNHQLFFSILGKGDMSEKFKEKIIEDFGSVENFKEEFIKNANYLVGSGYTFLVLNKENKLEIINTSNEDTPYSYGLIPIMNLDLWEHAYFLDYQNNKEDYINNFFSIVDFNKVSQNYEEIQKNL